MAHRSPPHVGWWNASMFKGSKKFRYWNGKKWSYAANYDTTSEQELIYAFTTPSNMDCHIKWRYFYPITAIKDRVNPQTGEITGKAGNGNR